MNEVLAIRCPQIKWKLRCLRRIHIHRDKILIRKLDLLYYKPCHSHAEEFSHPVVLILNRCVYPQCLIYHLCHSSTDWEGVRNLVSALPSSLKRIILVSSVGVTKFNELPWRYAFYIVISSMSIALR